MKMDNDLIPSGSPEDLMKELQNIKYALDQAAILAITDSKGVITGVNEQFCQISKYTKEELIGQTHRLVNSGHHPSTFFRDLWKTIKNGQIWRGEVKNRAKDGSYYWVDTTIVPLLNDRGEVTQFISFRADITDRKEMEKALRKSEEKFRKLALYDQLTHLPNGTFMEEQIRQLLLKKQPFYFLTMDLDRFKLINESYGLQFGDHLLIEVGERLKSFRTEHEQQNLVIARRGGDEFSFLILKTEASNYQWWAEQIIQLFHTPFEINRTVVHMNVSIGITEFPLQADHTDRLFQFADIAMYKAKEKLGNSYTFYQSGYQDDVNESWQLENDLRAATAKGDFELVYQPIFDLDKNRMTSVEVLIRWTHPTRGSVSPAVFIPLAEERGFILDIGDWVFRRAFEEYHTLVNVVKHPITLSINVSILQLVQENFVSNLKNLMEEYHINPEQLKLEVTETATMKHLNYIHHVLAELKQLNIMLAIDDFGTGYSSLNYLRHLPVDIVKIDRSFIQDMATNSVDLNILKAITSVCRSLDLQTTAEGVETVEQLEKLRECQCDNIQGYLVGKPMKLKDLLTVLNITSDMPI